MRCSQPDLPDPCGGSYLINVHSCLPVRCFLPDPCTWLPTYALLLPDPVIRVHGCLLVRFFYNDPCAWLPTYAFLLH